MLEKYKNIQPLFYEEINHCFSNDKISHAYLIETNNYNDAFNLTIDFVKEIFKHYVEKDEFENISTLIDNNTFSDFILVEPEKNIIKKDEILDIKEKFKTTSFSNRPRIYLIKDVDKLNKYAANSLLKFLEEPEGNIIAILLTNNRYKVMDTIRSRCQFYSLLGTVNHEKCDNIEDVEKVIEIIENYSKKSIAYIPINVSFDLKDKMLWINIINEMIYIYEKALRVKENIDSTLDKEIINIIVDKNSSTKIIHKINTLFETINNLEYNLNMSMMLDKFIIDFVGGD